MHATSLDVPEACTILSHVELGLEIGLECMGGCPGAHMLACLPMLALN